jgi:CRISPR-associated exonuclease Cas4
VWSERLQIAGFADFVEVVSGEGGGERGEGEEGRAKGEERGARGGGQQRIVPVEYKHGKKGQWDNDDIQLCAQALCLEEMTGQTISQGEIFYWRSRRRVTVPFDDNLRQMTETAVQQAQQLIRANDIPPPIAERQKCKHCSIQPICLPDEVEKLRIMN